MASVQKLHLIIDYELKKIWTETVVEYLKTLSQYLHGRTKNIIQNKQS